MAEERTEEQRLYYKSFEMALTDVEARLQMAHAKGMANKAYYNAYYRFKTSNRWDTEWIARQFVLVVGKISTLPKSERDFISVVGARARQIYDKQLNKSND